MKVANCLKFVYSINTINICLLLLLCNFVASDSEMDVEMDESSENNGDVSKFIYAERSAAENVEAGQAKAIDVSNWQGKIDWTKVAKTGVKHVFIKMSEGGAFVDPRFVENWKGAQSAGINVNCYHYFRALGVTPQKQMENIKKNIKNVNFDPAKNSLALDVEATGNENATPVQMADNLIALLDLIKKDPVLSKRPVVIYTSYGYWDTKVKWDKHDFSAYSLWVAHWGTNTPRLPEPWKSKQKSWVWWQYSSTGKVDGINGDVDMDWVKV